MSFHKITRIAEQPLRADKSAMCAINRHLQCIVSHHRHLPVSTTSCPFETPSRPSPKGLASLVTGTMEGKQEGVDGGKQYTYGCPGYLVKVHHCARDAVNWPGAWAQ